MEKLKNEIEKHLKENVEDTKRVQDYYSATLEFEEDYNTVREVVILPALTLALKTFQEKSFEGRVYQPDKYSEEPPFGDTLEISVNGKYLIVFIHPDPPEFKVVLETVHFLKQYGNKKSFKTDDLSSQVIEEFIADAFVAINI